MKQALCILALLLLAGCSDEPAAPEPEEPPTAGAIRGVVVTPTIHPIVGATVSIPAEDLSATSDLFGRFRFTDLDPGTYVLHATAEGHEPTDLTVQVVLGEAARPRIVLDPVQAPVVQHQTLEFGGRVPAWLGPVENETAPAQNATGVDGCQCTFDIPVPRYIVAVTIEATWEDEITAPAGTQYRWNLTAGNQSVSGADASPLHGVVGAGDLDFRSPMTLTLVPDEVWPTSDQEYQLFVTLWEVQGPPEGWSFIAGDR